MTADPATAKGRRPRAPTRHGTRATSGRVGLLGPFAARFRVHQREPTDDASCCGSALRQRPLCLHPLRRSGGRFVEGRPSPLGPVTPSPDHRRRQLGTLHRPPERPRQGQAGVEPLCRQRRVHPLVGEDDLAAGHAGAGMAVQQAEEEPVEVVGGIRGRHRSTAGVPIFRASEHGRVQHRVAEADPIGLALWLERERPCTRQGPRQRHPHDGAQGAGRPVGPEGCLHPLGPEPLDNSIDDRRAILRTEAQPTLPGQGPPRLPEGLRERCAQRHGAAQHALQLRTAQHPALRLDEHPAILYPTVGVRPHQALDRVQDCGSRQRPADLVGVAP